MWNLLWVSGLDTERVMIHRMNEKKNNNQTRCQWNLTLSRVVTVQLFLFLSEQIVKSFIT